MKTDLMLIGERHPLIHNITNYVAMNFVANSLLAIGASPIMARAEEEVGEISAKCQALALNLGIVESSTARSMQIAGKAAHENGVDSSIEPQEIEMKAIKLAQELSSVIVVTGSTDLVTDGHRVAHIKEGHQLMSKVTAMGCTATGIIGAFLAVSSDAFCASLHAMKVMGIAGEKAAAISRGNGSMMINFLDELCNLSSHE